MSLGTPITENKGFETSRSIPFSENSDILSVSNKLIFHEYQKLMQEMRILKSVMHKKEEKCQKLETQAQISRQYIKELEEENKRMKEAVNEIREKEEIMKAIHQERDTNELNNRIKELEIQISKLKKEKIQLIYDCIGKDHEIHELKQNIGKKLKNSDDHEPQVNGKENEVLANYVIPELQEQIVRACETMNWNKCEKLLRKSLNEDTIAYKQLKNIKRKENLPLSAANLGYIELIQVLLSNGLPINNGFDAISATMLHCAAYYGQYEVVKFLLTQGADVHVRDIRRHNTVLHSAAVTGHVDVIELLVDSGAKINVTDKYGNTPLHWAVTNERVSVVKYLCAKNCSKVIVNRDGLTALDIARRRRLTEIVDILCE